MKKIAKLTLTAALLAITVQSETITLQQGVNGYTGCTDSYLEHYLGQENFGNDQTFAAGSMTYQQG